MDLAEGVLQGKRRALARAISQAENGSTDGLLEALYPHTAHAHLIGVTGAPGTGKSSLVNQMALAYRKQGRRVAIVAVDPTSPFSGGAILGDRIRMRDLAGDPDVFIRSMASRGSLGGLARTTSDVTMVLAAAGFSPVIVETVGAGQSETEIARLAHTTLVIEAPGLGDDIQAMKAGILEIADVLVVNKSDDPRSANTVRALRTMLDLGDVRPATMHHGRLVEVTAPPPEAEDAWQVPIALTNGLTGEGVPELIEAIEAHRAHLEATGTLAHRERARAAIELDNLLREALLSRLLGDVAEEDVTTLINRIAARDTTPQAAVTMLLEGWLRRGED